MIVFDQETTGLTKPSLSDLSLQPYATEFCAVKIDKDFNFIGEIETLIKPGIPIPDDLVEKIGITNDMVAEAPSFIEVYPEISDFFMGERSLCAHNLAFDHGVLKYELMRHDLEFKFPWPKNHICTVERSYSIYNRRMRLGELHELATGKPIEGWHRAKNDVYALIRCLEYLVKQGYVLRDEL